MRKAVYIVLLAAMAIGIMACEKNKEDPDKLITAPVITALENSTFTLTDEADEFIFRMTWTSAVETVGGVADKSVAFSYALEFDLPAFENPKSIASVSENYFDVLMRNLSAIYGALDASGGESPVVAGLRVKATCADGVAFSDPVLVTIYPIEEEPEPQELTSVDKPVVNTPASTEFRLFDPGAQDVALVTITWSAPVFHFGDKTGTVTPLTYDVEFDSANNNFARGKVIGSVTDASITLRHRQIQEILLEWGAKPNWAYDAEIRIKASYGSGESAGVIYSDILSMRFIPYASFTATQLIWMIGDVNGWNNAEIGTMLPLFKNSNAATDGIYEYTGYVAGNTYFKFIPEMSLGSYLCFCAADGGKLVLEESEGGAFWEETGGFRKITLDTGTMTYTIENYDVTDARSWTSIGFIGTFTGWGSDIALNKASAENNHLWSKEASLPQGTDYHAGKFRADGGWAYQWNNFVGKEWETPFGTMQFGSANPETADVPRVDDVNIYFGPQAGDFYIAFNDLTCQYIVYRKP